MSSDPSAPFIVDWFRSDQNRELFRAWWMGSVLVVMGLFVGGVRFHPNAGELLQDVTLLLGLALTLWGLSHAVITSLKQLADNTCLLVRSDGVLFMNPQGAQSFLSWGDLKEAIFDPLQDCICLISEGEESKDLQLPAHFAGLKPLELIEKIHAAQRRALMGLLRAPRRETPVRSSERRPKDKPKEGS